MRLDTGAVGDVGTRLSTFGRFSRSPLAAPSRLTAGPPDRCTEARHRRPGTVPSVGQTEPWRPTQNCHVGQVTASDPKSVLHSYLPSAREAMVWKCSGLSWEARCEPGPHRDCLGLATPTASTVQGAGWCRRPCSLRPLVDVGCVCSSVASDAGRWERSAGVLYSSVGLDAGAFPGGFAVDRENARFGDEGVDVVADSERDDVVGGAPGRFADERGQTLVLQGPGERFAGAVGAGSDESTDRTRWRRNTGLPAVHHCRTRSR